MGGTYFFRTNFCGTFVSNQMKTNSKCTGCPEKKELKEGNISSAAVKRQIMKGSADIK